MRKRPWEKPIIRSSKLEMKTNTKECKKWSLLKNYKYRGKKILLDNCFYFAAFVISWSSRTILSIKKLLLLKSEINLLLRLLPNSWVN